MAKLRTLGENKIELRGEARGKINRMKTDPQVLNRAKHRGFDGRPGRQYKSAQTGIARADLRNSEFPGPDLIADEIRTACSCSLPRKERGGGKG